MDTIRFPRSGDARRRPALSGRAVAAWALVLAALVVLAACQAEVGTAPTSSGPTTASWADAAAAFSAEACTGCHGGSNIPNLTVCSELVQGFHVTAGSPSSSLVYLVADGTLGSPNGATDMKFDTTANLTTLYDWINGGASCS